MPSTKLSRSSDKQSQLFELGELKDDQVKFEKLIEYLPYPITVHTKGKIVYINKAAKKLLKAKSAKVLMGMPISKFVHRDFQKAASDRIKEVYKTGEPSPLMVQTLVNLQGEEIIAEVTGQLMMFDQKPSIFTIIRDITEKTSAAESLKESEDQYRSLFEGAHDLIQSVTTDGKFLYVNNAWLKTLGYKKTDLRKLTISDIIHADSMEHCMALLQKVVNGENVENIEAVFVAKNGNLVEVNGSASPRKIDGKVVATQGIFRDVTKTKRIEANLKESEERFQKLADSTTQGIAILYKGSLIQDANECLLEMLGYKRDQLIGKRLRNFIAPEDRKRISQNMEQGQLGPHEAKILKRDGTTFYAELKASPITYKGQYARVMAIYDITELKKTEEELRHNLVLIEETQKIANMGIWKWDVTNNAVTWSSGLYKIFGVDEKTYEGTFESYLNCVHPEDRKATQETIYGVMKEKKSVTFEERIIKPNEEIRYLRSWAGYISNDKGEISHLYGACMDITDKKKTEIELEAAFKEVSHLKLQLERENIYLQEEIQLHSNFENMVFASTNFREVLNKVEQVAPLDVSVLITGETGTGKELIARAVHNLSSRKERPMIKLNCGAIPKELVESELFGHEKGAFTGAVEKKLGRFELANGGTIFLDEVGEMPLDMQVKLLRVLQEGEFERVGGTQTIKVDVRVITATNRDLKKGTEDGIFRQDLYYRLNVFPIHIPPLRERSEDIPPLTELFVNKYSSKHGKEIHFVSQEVMDALQAYSWPGNVRELENMIERAVITSEDGALHFQELNTQTNGKPQKAASFTPKTLNDVERNYIMKVLNESKWKIGGANGAAQILDLKPSTLRDRMKKLNITRPAKT